jgi:hypothetical protein
LKKIVSVENVNQQMNDFKFGKFKFSSGANELRITVLSGNIRLESMKMD